MPVDVSVYRVVNGKPVEFIDGQDPGQRSARSAGAARQQVYAPHPARDTAITTFASAPTIPSTNCAPASIPAPPYDDPQQAVRTAVDYILGAGDSWFANTPRRGGVVNRVESTHQETSLCVGCHPSHFSQRAALYAAVNGYPVHQRQQLQFLSERFYNNPRPFYGFENEGAVWARVISAPANVLSRMSLITSLFETQISGEPRQPYHDAIAKYLDLYYAGRTAASAR